MNAKKWVKEEERLLARSKSRRSCGDSGGIKLLPSLIHGDEAPVRNNSIPVHGIPMNGNRVDLEALEDW